MLDEDEDQGFGEAKVPIPNFDRGSKPAVSDKSRNFAAVWGTSKKGVCWILIFFPILEQMFDFETICF